jgi:hypothetical protein
MLDLWPPLPIVIKVNSHESLGVHNVIAALKHSDRVCGITFSASSGVTRSEMENILEAMQHPFPALTRLHLWFQDILSAPFVPASFLGGSAPRLETLSLDGIPFPELPKLLLSASHLVRLDLSSNPMSAEAMVTGLSLLTRLESLVFTSTCGFSRDLPGANGPCPTCVLLPALTELQFEGARCYLEKLVARIDAPRLDKLKINFDQYLIYGIPELCQFITRTSKLKVNDEAHVAISDRDICIKFPQTFDGELELKISTNQLFGHSNRRLWSLDVLASSFGHLIPTVVESLYIFEDRCRPPHWEGDNGYPYPWPEVFESFTAVKGLYISREFIPRIAPALQDLVVYGSPVLPALQTFFLEDSSPSKPVQENIRQFVVARQLTVARWERE